MRMIAVFFFFFSHYLFAANESISQLIFVKGKVELHTPSDKVISLAKGDTISEGDEVSTGTDAFAILRLADQNIIKLEPESSFALKKLAPIVDGKSYGVTETLIHKGRVFFEVPNEDKVEKLRVTTKTLAFAVRGTKFLVDTASDDNIWLGVNEGEVEVSSLQDKSKHDVVLPSEAMNFEKGKTFTKPQKYDWMKKVDFNIKDTKNYRSGLSNVRQQRKSEFKQKRQKWSFNKERFQKRAQQWQQRKEAFQKRHEKTLNTIRQRKQQRGSQGNRQSRQLRQRGQRFQQRGQGLQQRGQNRQNRQHRQGGQQGHRGQRFQQRGQNRQNRQGGRGHRRGHQGGRRR